MTQSPIVKYGLAGILSIGLVWGYEVGSASVKEMVSMPLVEEIKAQTKENVRPIPTNLQTLYLVQINEGDFPTIASSRSEPLPEDIMVGSVVPILSDTQPEMKREVVKKSAPRIAAATEAGVILSGYGFVAVGDTLQVDGHRWKLTGSFEKGYAFSSI